MARFYEMVTLAAESECDGKEEYIAHYGPHFNEKLCEWAVSMMTKRDPITRASVKMSMIGREEVLAMLHRYGVDTSSYDCYDAVYVANMAKADYLGSSIADETHLALFVKDYLTDIDGYEGKVFYRFLTDCKCRGLDISWEDVM